MKVTGCMWYQSTNYISGEVCKIQMMGIDDMISLNVAIMCLMSGYHLLVVGRKEALQHSPSPGACPCLSAF